MKQQKKYFTTIIAVAATFLTVHSQIQKGQDIDGEVMLDHSGVSVSMPDANMVAVGAHRNGGRGTASGHVRIFKYKSNKWLQHGDGLVGEKEEDQSGWSVSMPDINTVAIGAILNDGGATDAGQVRVYGWNGTMWMQKGADIDGEAAEDRSGYSVSMPDVNTVAVGAFLNDGNGTDAGQVRVYSWDGSVWVKKGNDIDGETPDSRSGYSVSMPDANTVAIGAPYNDGKGSDAGQVRIFNWDGSNWVQKGVDIDGETANDYSGYSVSMPDANTVAIGAVYNSGNEFHAGHVRIYSWNGSAWTQKGMDIDGEAADDQSGGAISMPDANTIAIGAIGNEDSGIDAGHVRVYKWKNNAWVQKLMDINGEHSGDISGSSVSMPDSNTVAIGAPANTGNGVDAGHVRIYSLDGAIGVTQNNFGNNFMMYPNPTTGFLSFDLGNSYSNITVTVRNALGQEISQEIIKNAVSKIQTNLSGNKGIYFVEIISADKRALLKVMKK